MTDLSEDLDPPDAPIPVSGLLAKPSEEDGPHRPCGRCQSWVPAATEIHACVKAPRTVGYAWYEPDEPELEKNAILTSGRAFKPGNLIATFPAGGGEIPAPAKKRRVKQEPE